MSIRTAKCYNHVRMPTYQEILRSQQQRLRAQACIGKRAAQYLQIAKFCDSHPVSVRKIRQKMLRYTALFVQNNIRVKPLDYGCVRALPKEDVQPGD